MSLSYKDIGNGKPFVLIHAFPLSNEMWEAQADLLAANGFRVILPDLPGFGKNDRTSPRYPITEMAEQIAEILDFLHIEKAIIGGLSMGGYVLCELFRIAPEKFSALILCDTTYLADTVEKRNSRFELISKIEAQGSSALIENMLPNLISEDTKRNNPALTVELENIFSKVNPVSAANALRSMAERKDNSEIIVQISVPTLLIFGEFDQVTNLENARRMHQMIPGSEFVIIEKAGHYSNLEQTVQFNKALLDFCRRVEI
jgi:pimeloyl-ACP methyl ester carboxylesterase